LTKPTVTLSWPAKSRDINAPMSALSATITFRSAGANGGDVSMIVDRPVAPAAVRLPCTMTTPVVAGYHVIDVVFYSSGSGSGSEVADATAGVVVSPSGTLLGPSGAPLGNVAYASTISSVTVIPNQVTPPNVAFSPGVTAFSADGTIAAFGEGQTTFQVTNGTGAATNVGGAIKGTKEGTVFVSATVDGQTSPPQTVTIQTAATTGYQPRSLSQATNRLVLNPKTGTIWASVPGSAARNANCVVEIDPASGTVLNSVSIGSEPNVLAMSDDGTTLYVSQDASSSVRPVDTVAHTAGTPFALINNGGSGATTVDDMAVQPGNPKVVAVTIHDVGDSGFSGPEIYDQGVMRPNSLGTYQGWWVAFSDPSTLWTLGSSNPNNLNKARVDSSGATLIGNGVPLHAYDPFMRIFGNRIYGAGGGIGNASTGFPIGTLPVSNGDSITVDTTAGLAFVAEIPVLTLQIGVFDINKFTRVTTLAIPSIQLMNDASQYQGTDILRWGAKGLAVRTPTQVLFIDQAPGL